MFRAAYRNCAAVTTGCRGRGTPPSRCVSALFREARADKAKRPRGDSAWAIRFLSCRLKENGRCSVATRRHRGSWRQRRQGLPRLSAVALLIAAVWSAPVSAAGYNNRGAAAAARQRAISALQAQLAEARQVLAAAQAELAQAQGKIDESKSRVETAKGRAGVGQVRAAQFASSTRSNRSRPDRESRARLRDRQGPG